MVMNRRGVVRIIEATIAIVVILAAVLLIGARNNDAPIEDLTKEISPILEEIAHDATLRENIINNPEATVEDSLESGFLKDRIQRADLEYALEICEPSEICALEVVPTARDGNLYSEERIISTYRGEIQDNLRSKKVKIFIWRK